MQEIQVRQISAGSSESELNPAAKAQAVSGDAEVVAAHFELHHFAHELDAIAIGLQKADVGVAIDSEFRVVKFGAEFQKFRSGNPRRGYDDVIGETIR